MILPTRNIAADRALLTVAGRLYDGLGVPTTISRLWDDWRDNNRDRPISYGWFILALDLLFLMGLIWFDQNDILHRVER